MGNPIATVPGNLAGTLAGAVAMFAVGALAKAGYMTALATFLNQQEVTVDGMAMIVIGAVVNYGVSHVAGIRRVNDLYAMLPTLKTYPDYNFPKQSPLEH